MAGETQHSSPRSADDAMPASINPQCSIVMATYQGAHYLQEQLDSFTSQDLLPDELVVCDDGSSDATWSCLQRYQEAVPFKVTLYRNKHKLGVTRNFERAIGLATGNLIFLCDQDDVWFPNKMQCITDYFRSHPNVMVVTNDQELTDSVLTPSGQTTFAQFRSSGVPGQPFCVGCCTAFRREFLALLLPIPDAQDSHDIWLHNLADILKVRATIDKVLQYHRRHGSNTSDSRLNPLGGRGAVNSISQAWASDPQVTGLYRKEMLDSIEHRLKALDSSQLDQFIASRVPSALKAISEERLAINSRLQLRQYAHINRVPAATRLLLNGGYRYFRGWKSFIKDLIR